MLKFWKQNDWQEDDLDDLDDDLEEDDDGGGGKVMEQSFKI